MFETSNGVAKVNVPIKYSFTHGTVRGLDYSKSENFK